MSNHLISPPQPMPQVIAPELFDPTFLERLSTGLNLACQWLTEVAQLQEQQPDRECYLEGIFYQDWRGAIKGEYSAKEQRWGFFCPYWHTGQALKALLMAEPWINDAAPIREAASKAGGFLLTNRITDTRSRDLGLPLAYEDSPHTINTSAILEAIDGLLLAGEAFDDPSYEEAACAALQWVGARAYRKGQGVFENSYNPKTGEFVTLEKFRGYPEAYRARPLLDDAVFLKGFHRFGCTEFRSIFYETAERLLKEEHPTGNWIRFSPCHSPSGRIHPRHAYWWGGPMIDAWMDSKDRRFYDTALRSLQWYAGALRKDGGLFRNNYIDGGSDSFGHATSGGACAAILFIRAATDLDDPGFLPMAKNVLDYCLNVQFRNPSDPNLRGAILEKVIPPDGTDASPYHLRDLGTIFFIQAAALYLAVGKASATAAAAPLNAD